MKQLFDEHMVNLADFDCFSQVTFKGVDDYKRMREDPWYRKQIAGDHVNFADTQRSMMTIGWVTDFIEHGKLVEGDTKEFEREHKGSTESSTKTQASAIILGSFLSGTPPTTHCTRERPILISKIIGSMMSLSLMAVPVLLDTTANSPQLFHQWARMYHYGHQVLPGMAIGTFLLYCYACIRRRKADKPKPWRLLALAGLFTVSIIPFTLLVMKPTNDELFRLEKVTSTVRTGGHSEVGVTEAKGLVIKWALMHFTRSCFPLMGAISGALGTFWH
jgi:hypothetical protein